MGAAHAESSGSRRAGAAAAFLLVEAHGAGTATIWHLIFRSLTASLLWNTVRLTVVVTALCAVIGTAAAWFVERTDLPGRRVWAVLVVVPLGKLPVHQRGEPLPSGCPVSILIRPEQIELHSPAGGNGRLRGEVVSCGYHGHDAILRVRTRSCVCGPDRSTTRGS